MSGVSGSGFVIEGGRILTNAHVIADARQILVRRPDQAEPLRGDARGGGERLRPGRAPRRRPRLRPRACGPSPSAPCRAPGPASTPTASRSAARTSPRPPASSRASSRAATCTAAPTPTSWCRRTPPSTPATAAGPWSRTAAWWGSPSRASPAPTTWASSSRCPIVRHFLANLEDGRYDGFPDSGLDTTPLLSPAYRRERGLPAGRSGVVVDRVAPGGTADGVLKPGDVLLSVEGQPDRRRRHHPPRRRSGDLRARDRHDAGRERRCASPSGATAGAGARGARPAHRPLRPQPEPLRRRPRLRRLRRARLHAARDRAAQDPRPRLAAERQPRPRLAPALPGGRATRGRRPRGDRAHPRPAPRGQLADGA